MNFLTPSSSWLAGGFASLVRGFFVVLLALTLTACGRLPPSGDTSPAGRVTDAWRQFLELDDATSYSPPTVAPGGFSRSLSTRTDEVNEELRRLYVDENANADSFSAMQDSYRTTLARARSEIEKARTAKGVDPAETNRRIAVVASRVPDLLDRQHQRILAMQKSFKQELDSAVAKSEALDRDCVSAAGDPAAPAAQKQSCSKFEDGYSMVKAKAEFVNNGFTQVEQTYQEMRKSAAEIATQPAPAAVKNAPAAVKNEPAAIKKK